MMKKLILSLSILALIVTFKSCVTDHPLPVSDPTKFTSEPFVNELQAPIGLEVDDKGNIWVSEAGTGNDNDDGSISMITPSGEKTLFVGGLTSKTNMGSIEGMSKLLYRSGKLYFLHGIDGLLYVADVSSFKAGDPHVELSSIESHDVGKFVKDKVPPYTTPVNSNIFDLTFGPDNNLYIVDAGANVILKRDQTSGEISEFAVLPKTAGGSEAVPTGIVFDGSHFVVTTLTGFPFTPDAAKIFKVTPGKTVTSHDTKFTTLVGIALSVNNKPIVLQHGVFGMGFTPGTGKVVDENNNTLLEGLTQPTDIVRSGDKTYYLLSYKDGTISKLTY
jgi:hypothetical protein